MRILVENKKRYDDGGQSPPYRTGVQKRGGMSFFVDFPHIFTEAIVPERNLLEQWGTFEGEQEGESPGPSFTLQEYESMIGSPMLRQTRLDALRIFPIRSGNVWQLTGPIPT